MITTNENLCQTINSEMLLEIAKKKFVKMRNEFDDDSDYWITENDVQAKFAPFSDIGDKKGTISIDARDKAGRYFYGVATYDLDKQTMELKGLEEIGYDKFDIQDEELGKLVYVIGSNFTNIHDYKELKKINSRIRPKIAKQLGHHNFDIYFPSACVSCMKEFATCAEYAEFMIDCCSSEIDYVFFTNDEFSPILGDIYRLVKKLGIPVLFEGKDE